MTRLTVLIGLVAAIAAGFLTACGGNGEPDSALLQTACTPRVVTVAVLGDSTNYALDINSPYLDIDWSQAKAAHSPPVELQALMDAKYGLGAVIVTNDAYPGTDAWQAPIVSADVVIENYGINDMNDATPVDVYTANVKAIHATIVETQFPTPYGDVREGTYVQAIRGLGTPVADMYAYIQSLPDWHQYFPHPLSVHTTDALYKMLTDNVLAPLVMPQVDAVRRESCGG